MALHLTCKSVYRLDAILTLRRWAEFKNLKSYGDGSLLASMDYLAETSGRQVADENTDDGG